MGAMNNSSERPSRMRILLQPTVRPLDTETYILCPPTCSPEKYCGPHCTCHGTLCAIHEEPCDTLCTPYCSTLGDECPTRCELCNAYC